MSSAGLCRAHIGRRRSGSWHLIQKRTDIDSSSDFPTYTKRTFAETHLGGKLFCKDRCRQLFSPISVCAACVHSAHRILTQVGSIRLKKNMLNLSASDDLLQYCGFFSWVDGSLRWKAYHWRWLPLCFEYGSYEFLVTVVWAKHLAFFTILQRSSLAWQRSFVMSMEPTIPPYLLLRLVVTQGSYICPPMHGGCKNPIKIFLVLFTSLVWLKEVFDRNLATSMHRWTNVGPLGLNVGPFEWLIWIGRESPD